MGRIPVQHSRNPDSMQTSRRFTGRSSVFIPITRFNFRLCRVVVSALKSNNVSQFAVILEKFSYRYPILKIDLLNIMKVTCLI